MQCPELRQTWYSWWSSSSDLYPKNSNVSWQLNTKRGWVYRPDHQSFHISNISLLYSPSHGPPSKGQMYNDNIARSFRRVWTWTPSHWTARSYLILTFILKTWLLYPFGIVRRNEEMKRRENVSMKVQGREEALDNSLKKKDKAPPTWSSVPFSYFLITMIIATIMMVVALAIIITTGMVANIYREFPICQALCSVLYRYPLS